ncbi:hypothetical protein CLV58_112133 [Spirosoma oryzae]|uniref:Uncharacterized protein n=1 Tax=Spirosoma oryzae TaxID=1469603 RepID=A0A2T0ST00_9BACT|nr:hypothetical protein CLV58_112133 [Spirosoma oryzae]
MHRPDELVFVADENFDYSVVKALSHFPVFQIHRFYKLQPTERQFCSPKIKISVNSYTGSVCRIVVFYWFDC